MQLRPVSIIGNESTQLASSKMSSLWQFSVPELKHLFESQAGKRNKLFLQFEWNHLVVLKNHEPRLEFPEILHFQDAADDLDDLHSKCYDKIQMLTKIFFLELKLSKNFRYHHFHQSVRIFVGLTLDVQKDHSPDLPNKGAIFSSALFFSSVEQLSLTEVCHPLNISERSERMCSMFTIASKKIDRWRDAQPNALEFAWAFKTYLPSSGCDSAARRDAQGRSLLF
jgi:hypothetical protein